MASASDKELTDLVMKLRTLAASPARMKQLVLVDAPKRKAKPESAQKQAQRAKLVAED